MKSRHRTDLSKIRRAAPPSSESELSRRGTLSQRQSVSFETFIAEGTDVRSRLHNIGPSVRRHDRIEGVDAVRRFISRRLCSSRLTATQTQCYLKLTETSFDQQEILAQTVGHQGRMIRDFSYNFRVTGHHTLNMARSLLFAEVKANDAMTGFATEG